MAAAAINTSAFPLFSTLAPELRNQIWRDALPNKVRPALFFYKKGCWCLRGVEPDLTLEFHHDLLDNTQFEIPLAFVNREARSIALAWIREHGIKIRPRQEQYPVFVRPFDPMLDALYIEPSKCVECLTEIVDRTGEPDLLNRAVSIESIVKCIAIPEALLRNKAAIVPEMFYSFANLRVLLVIVNAPSDLQSADNDDMKVQQWGFESAQGDAFFWNANRHGFDFSSRNKYDGNEAVSRLLEDSEEVNRELTQGFLEHGILSFEIRPVLAVRR